MEREEEEEDEKLSVYPSKARMFLSQLCLGCELWIPVTVAPRICISHSSCLPSSRYFEGLCRILTWHSFLT